MQMPALPRRYHAASIWLLYAAGLVPAAWYVLSRRDRVSWSATRSRSSSTCLANGPQVSHSDAGDLALRDIFGINWVRTGGRWDLLAFYYVAMHFLAYMVLDKRLALA
jgi:sulfoxide reductase heme-binding subunit YedZ